MFDQHVWNEKSKHCFIDEIVDIALSATQIPLSIFTYLFHQRFEKHSMLESMLEIFQQVYIWIETEPHDFVLFPGDYSLNTLRCIRCGQRVTVAGSIGETPSHCNDILLKHDSMTSKITENWYWRHYFLPLMTIIYNHQNLIKYVWTGWGMWNLVAKTQPSMDSLCFMRLLRLIWQISWRHYSTTQYQPHFLSSLCYLKIYLKPSTYTRISVVERRTLNHPSHPWIKPIHVMDMTLTLISSTMMSTMHYKKNFWCCLRLIASLVFGLVGNSNFRFWFLGPPSEAEFPFHFWFRIFLADFFLNSTVEKSSNRNSDSEIWNSKFCFT